VTVPVTRSGLGVIARDAGASCTQTACFNSDQGESGFALRCVSRLKSSLEVFYFMASFINLHFCVHRIHNRPVMFMKHGMFCPFECNLVWF
jgi:hypothetical protein